MKIAIIGCGAMGSIYAAKLAAAAGNEVVAIDCHQASVDQIARQLPRVTGPGCDQVVPLRANTAPPAEPMDLILLAVKAADVTTGARQALPMLGAATPVLTIQNGLGSAETVAGIVGDHRVAVGIASGFGAARIAAGHVHHNAVRAMRFGAYSSLSYATVESIARAWTDAGFDASAVTDIAPMQWEKLICNFAYSAPCALTRMTVGLRVPPALRGSDKRPGDRPGQPGSGVGGMDRRPGLWHRGHRHRPRRACPRLGRADAERQTVGTARPRGAPGQRDRRHQRCGAAAGDASSALRRR